MDENSYANIILSNNPHCVLLPRPADHTYKYNIQIKQSIKTHTKSPVHKGAFNTVFTRFYISVRTLRFKC